MVYLDLKSMVGQVLNQSFVMLYIHNCTWNEPDRDHRDGDIELEFYDDGLGKGLCINRQNYM